MLRRYELCALPAIVLGLGAAAPAAEPKSPPAAERWQAGGARVAWRSSPTSGPMRPGMREVPVKISDYPASGGRCPVVIFSHGLGGSRDGDQYLGRHWASHGYVSRPSS